MSAIEIIGYGVATFFFGFAIGIFYTLWRISL